MFQCFPSMFSKMFLRTLQSQLPKNVEQKNTHLEQKNWFQLMENQNCHQDGMLKGLLKHFPQLEGRIQYVEMGSPLSNRHYLNRAASYGLQHPPGRYTVKEGLRPGQVGNIEGMWITGGHVKDLKLKITWGQNTN